MANTLQDAMAAAGLTPVKAINLHPDGKIHRYRVMGDKPGSVNGWYVSHNGIVAVGAFGSWKTSESHTWRETTSKPLTPAEWAEIARHTEAAKQAHTQERESVQAAARAKAQRLWRTLTAADYVNCTICCWYQPATTVARCIRCNSFNPMAANGFLPEGAPAAVIAPSGGLATPCYWLKALQRRRRCTRLPATRQRRAFRAAICWLWRRHCAANSPTYG